MGLAQCIHRSPIWVGSRGGWGPEPLSKSAKISPTRAYRETQKRGGVYWEKSIDFLILNKMLKKRGQRTVAPSVRLWSTRLEPRSTSNPTLVTFDQDPGLFNPDFQLSLMTYEWSCQPHAKTSVNIDVDQGWDMSKNQAMNADLKTEKIPLFFRKNTGKRPKNSRNFFRKKKTESFKFPSQCASPVPKPRSTWTRLTFE